MDGSWFKTQIAAATGAALAAIIAGCIPRGGEQKFSRAFAQEPAAAAFAWAGDFSQGLAPVQVRRAGPAGDSPEIGGFGYVDTSGRLAIPAAFAAAGVFSGNRAPVLRNGLWGYVDVTGRMAIAPRFDWAGPFREGLAAVSAPGGCRFIDTAGLPLGEAVFLEARAFSQGLAAVRVGVEDSGAWGFIDTAGEIAIPPLFAGVPRGFSEGLAAVQVDADSPARMGFIDTSGGFAIDTLFDAAGDFSEGLAPVARTGLRGGPAWGFVDATGAVVIEPRFRWAGGFRGGRALAVLPGGGHAFIGRDGASLAELPDSIVPLPSHAGSRIDGDRVPFRLRKRYGYLDAAGAPALPPRFREAGPFREGWARARLGGPGRDFWVFVDRRGKYLTGNIGVTGITLFPKSR